MDRDEFPDKISIDDLYTKKKVTEQHKIQCYKKILNRVHSKIKNNLENERVVIDFVFFCCLNSF